MEKNESLSGDCMKDVICFLTRDHGQMYIIF